MMSMDQPVSNLKYYQVLDYLETERWRSTDRLQRWYPDPEAGRTGSAGRLPAGQHHPVQSGHPAYIDQYEQTNDTTFKRNYLPAQETSLLVSLLPTLLLLGGMALLWVFMMRAGRGRQRQDEHLGKAKPKRWTTAGG